MRIRIELVDDLAEDEITIRCRQVNDDIQRIHQLLAQQASRDLQLVFFKDNQEFFFPLRDVLFFETLDEKVYAHTKNDSFKVKMRLYELEATLPHQFIRAAKSAIVNVDQIYSITRGLSSTSLILFLGSHKQLFCSRRYFQSLKTRINERRTQP